MHKAAQDYATLHRNPATGQQERQKTMVPPTPDHQDTPGGLFHAPRPEGEADRPGLHGAAQPFPGPSSPHPAAPAEAHLHTSDTTQALAAILALDHTLARFYRLIMVVVVLAVLAVVISTGGPVLMVVCASALVAVVLHGAARWITHLLRLPEWLSVMLLVLALGAAATALVHVFGPEIVVQAAHLRTALVSQISALHDRLNSGDFGRLILDHVPQSLGGNQSGAGSRAPGLDFAGSMTNVLTSTFGSVGTLIVIVIAGIYFALSPRLYANGILRLTPERHRPLVRSLLQTIAHTLSAWVAGQMLDMTVVGVLTWLGLWAIGMPLALPLGLVAGTANFIPYLGAFVGAIPALLIGLSVGTQEALMVLGLYSVIQAFEGYIMSPFIQKRAVSMPPALTILSQTIFGAFLGMWGFIFASPITAVLLAVATRLASPLKEKDML
ncbi:AI-2E family transporter [Acetobacter persici]|uniref:AI-2E family transporter n=1 Tax=Acetobacter persici TaxID=1076596 RepID=UPI001FD36FA1|nr:AI-2E family transporter [Acetobacter persici]